jgi:hypothetical protein
LIGIVTVGLISALFPKLESVDTDYSVGMIWSKEDLIAPFSFPIYKSEQVYKKELEEAQSKVYPIFDINSEKAGGMIDWLDSLRSLQNKIDKIYSYESELIKEKNLPEEKRTTSEHTLTGLKNELSFNLTEAEWKALYSAISSPAGRDAFKKKIVQSLNQVSSKTIIIFSNLKYQSVEFRI